MNNAIKAALLSAFVFPGAGHVLLKRYITAAVIAGVAFTALYVLISNAVDKAMDIVDQIQRGEIQADVAVITELVAKQPTGSEAQLLNITTAILLIFWLIGVIDAYRIGRALDRTAVAHEKQENTAST